MKKICFVTGTRADYGIMAPLMQALNRRKEVELQIIATNMHLSPQFGMTVNEIIADGLNVDWRIDSLLSGDSPASTVKTMGLTQIGMADALSHLRPDLIVILGDRYEMLAAASAAL
ncbi:MAG: UDP-N-acetylglucosamine 2-epimerase, partial [Muribaculaceae bacterium]|nr:UDP-N-acetylglucosamine 2-epimerase [Muribaculaceae bacterium]